MWEIWVVWSGKGYAQKQEGSKVVRQFGVYSIVW